MKQIEYKNVVVRPRLIPFDDWHKQEVDEYVNDWLKRKADREHNLDPSFDKTTEEYRESVEKWGGTERAYWDRQGKWFVFFPNGRIVKMPKRKWNEPDDAFNARLDKIIAKVEKESTTEYGRFSAMMQKLLLERMGIGCAGLIYPTSYGIGVWAIYNWYFREMADAVEKVLNSIGVEYQTEYSEANWVFRYKISKKAANLALLK